jgi:hypothetical protein
VRQGRRVRRVVRRVEPWTVLRASILFYLSLCMILLVAGTLLWLVADAVDVVDNVESFIAEIGFDEFEFLPVRILRGAVLVGLVLVLVGTAANVLMAVLYNLISDVVGGIEVVVLEEVPATTQVTSPGAATDGAPEPTRSLSEPAPARSSAIFERSEDAPTRSLGL